VALGRALVTRNPDAVEPELARSLSTLCDLLRKLDQPAEALAAGRPAVVLRRKLTRRNPDAHWFDLAYSLVVLGDLQRAVGQHKRASASHDEAAGLYRKLSPRNPLTRESPAVARRATG
jgi:hypothetical protein